MSREDFIELTTITDVDGVVQAVITYKLKQDGSKMISFSFMRSFDDNGVNRRTCWTNLRHIDAILRLIPRVKERIREEELKCKATLDSKTHQ